MERELKRLNKEKEEKERHARELQEKVRRACLWIDKSDTPRQHHRDRASACKPRARVNANP